MPDVTSDRFLTLLENSNLLAAEQSDNVRADFAIANEQQLPQLITQLIERGWLTRWQAKMEGRRFAQTDDGTIRPVDSATIEYNPSRRPSCCLGW